MELKITLISDTHGNHASVNIEPCEILVFAGDYSTRNRENELMDFIVWLKKQPVGNIVLVSGNHDKFVYRHNEQFQELMRINEIIYLHNSSAKVCGINFWGSPIVVPEPESFITKVQLNDLQRKEIWDKIPTNTDIVVTHTPPFGINDVERNSHFGCKFLLEKIMEIKPKYHLFGHIHQSHGETEFNGIKFKNGSLAADDTQQLKK